MKKTQKSGRMAIVAGAVAFSFLGLSTSAKANYVTNGNFTSTVSGSPLASGGDGSIYNYNSGINSGTTQYASYLTGWNVITPQANEGIANLYTGNYGSYITNGFGTNNFQMADSSHITAPPLGGNFVAVDASVGVNSVLLVQTLTNLSPNTTYTLTYEEAGDAQAGAGNPSGPEFWSVSFGNATDGFAGYGSATQGAISASNTFSGWVAESTTFTTGAHATSETLQFFAEGPSSAPPMLFLADVNLSSPSATPEPSTFALGALALIMGLVYRAKRKTATVA